MNTCAARLRSSLFFHCKGSILTILCSAKCEPCGAKTLIAGWLGARCARRRGDAPRPVLA